MTLTICDSMAHFVLVHGSGKGGWCWYKLAALLVEAGHRVTVPDLRASGIHGDNLEQVKNLASYLEPLMEVMASLPEEEKVVLVGHSYGGVAISLAMEKFPEKVLVAVFVTAIMGGPLLSLFQVEEEFLKRLDDPMDCTFNFEESKCFPTSFAFGRDFIVKSLYQQCDSKDIMLAQSLVRPAKLFLEDLSAPGMLTESNYGSILRFYIVCKGDQLIKQDFQKWMIEKNQVKEVKEIEGSDHMVMLSKPTELCACLLGIAVKYIH